MAEKSAAELLYAQLDHDVATAKEKIAFGKFTDASMDEAANEFEALAEAVCKRWWIRRMTVKPNTENIKDLQERMTHRMNILAHIVQGIIDKSGSIDLNGLQMQVLGISAEMNAMWGTLIELGLITSANRQDYMDAAIAGLYQRAQNELQKIIVAPPTGRAS